MDAPAGKAYEGPSGVGRDSVWLTAEDLIEGRDATVKIERVILYPEVTFLGGRKRLNLLGLKFAGKARVLGLNATNRKALNKAFGNIVKAWIGQEVTLYVSETQLAGETVKCVRIRDRGSRAASAAEEFLGGEAEVEPAATDARSLALGVLRTAGADLDDAREVRITLGALLGREVADETALVDADWQAILKAAKARFEPPPA